MSEFLFEIGCEEIPARMLPGAIAELRSLWEGHLRGQRIGFAMVESHGTPRRLYVGITGLAERQTDQEEERRGPPVARAYDQSGNITQAVEGFARGCGVPVERLERRATPKGEYLVCTLRHSGLPTREVLPAIMAAVIRELTWAKAMIWESREQWFVRPIRYLVALLDGAVVPFELNRAVCSGERVRGHRFMSSGWFTVSGIADYQATLAEQHVVLSMEERMELITRQAAALAEGVGGRLNPDPALVRETACLVEKPVPMLGSFDPGYLGIPPEVLVTSMRNHQKYFTVLDSGGRLLPHFVAVANLVAADPGVIIRGYERVLRARLEDAAFYWREDRKQPLAARVEGLRNVVFQERLGSLHDKVERIEALSDLIAGHVGPLREFVGGTVKRAALLAKCDLITGMVGEFPELQGIMGYYYALDSGESERVAMAIREHYLPQGAADALPQSRGGMALALADKLDTLTGCFGIGLVPTGDKDPFALRRAALGVIRIVIQGDGIRLRLRDLLNAAYVGYPATLLAHERRDAVVDAIMEFFYGRLQSYLKTEGYDYDLIDAVSALGLDDLYDAVARVRALAGFKRLPEYAALVAANKRIANILEKSSSEEGCGQVNAAGLSEAAERELHGAVVSRAREVERLVSHGEYARALTVLAQLRPAIDDFFAQVLVNAPEAKTRSNRLRLLGQVRTTFRLVADVSRLVVSEG